MHPRTSIVFALALLALVTSGFAAMFLFEGRRHARRAKALALTVASRVAAIAQGGRVLVEGRAVAGPDGPLRSPLTGASVVWYRVVVDEVIGSSRTSVLDDSSAREFFIDDGSGRLALIEPFDVYDDIPPVDVDASVTDALVRLLKSKGIDKDLRRLVCNERVVRVGQLVVACGEARKLSTMLKVPYRDDAEERLIIGHGGDGEERQLVLSTKRMTSVVADELHKMRVRYWSAGAMLALAIAFVVMATAR